MKERTDGQIENPQQDGNLTLSIMTNYIACKLSQHSN